MLATMRSFFILSLFCLVGWSNSQSCPARYQRFTPQHTFCIAPNPTCEIWYTGITQEIKELILRIHNEWRSKVAMGNERGSKDGAQLPQAADMMQMEWDDELAAVAQKWSENCLFEHDCNECRAVENFAVGQNLAIRYYGPCRSDGCPDTDNEPDWIERFTSLYDEVADYYTSWLDSYESHPGPMTGHFTQLIWSTSWKVGCGYSYYKQENTIYKYYACNYGPEGNFQGQPVYEKGEPCSSCPTNTQCSTSSNEENTFPGLCKMNDPNTSPTYQINSEGLLFYCGASSSDPDCQLELSGDGTLETVNSIGGNYYSIVLNGGQSSTIAFNNQIIPHGDTFCLELTFRKGTLDASDVDQSNLQIDFQFDADYSASPTKLDLHTTTFSIQTVDLNYSENPKLSFTFSVPNGAGEHVFDLRKIVATDGTCA